MRTEVTCSRGRTLVRSGSALAEVRVDDDVVDVHFSTPAGHQPTDVRSSLVAAVFDLPELRTSRLLRATVPLGDAELLIQVRRRCPSARSRAAGASCLVDAPLH